MRERWIVLGAGYAGSRLAKSLASEGHQVMATVREPAAAIALEQSMVRALVQEWDEVDVRVPILEDAACVLSLPPSKSGDLGLESRALDWAYAAGARRFVYWSSTSVYGESEGAEVRESSPVRPTTRIGLRRREAELRVEEWARARGVQLATMRLVGIYGPHRNLKQRIERGDYAIVDDGSMWSNRIHVDDIVSATRRILAQADIAGEWLVSDGNPFEVRDFVRWNIEALNLEMPPSVALESLPERARAFWTGNRRVRPERLESIGWSPRWPSFREGSLAAWEVERREGEK